MISYDEFEGLAARFSVVPLVHTMLADMLTPVSAYLALREPAVASFLFESVEPDQKIGRHSFIGTRPQVLVRARGNTVLVKDRKGTTSHASDIFTVLSQLSAQYSQAPGCPRGSLSGGFVGYIGYDNVRYLERVSIRPPSEGEEDDAVFGLFSNIVKFDHRGHTVTIIVNVIVDPAASLKDQYVAARNEADTLSLRLQHVVVPPRVFRCDLQDPRGDLDRDSFCTAVGKAKEHIRAGDIFQVVLSRELRFPFEGDLFAAYRALRVVNPSPYLFFLDFCDITLAGSSPEVLVRVQDTKVEVLPIAGTRPRGVNEQDDKRLEHELLDDAKERAEHIMLVDLGRNDVGRVAEFGTVRVPELMRIERYSHVMHIVSEVCGTLKRDLSSLDALKACFPAGTVSGAPKVRAMEIIHDLEQRRRGTYAGAVGYLGFDGSLDTCIAIRTIVARRDYLSVQVGAGIVADSIPENEFQETKNKSQALLEAIAMANAGFTRLSSETVITEAGK